MVYKENEITMLMDNDELDPFEAAFMEGYSKSET